MTAPEMPRRTGEPRLASIASWAVLAASFGLSASTWIALGVLAGFTSTLTVFGVTARLAWLMPIAVDGYVVVALVLWMAPVPARVAAFAKRNTYLAAGTGIVAQSAYHLLFTMSTTDQWWRVVLAALVGALPPTVAGLAVHMRALIRRESGHHHNQPSTVDTTTVPTAVTRPAPAAPSTMDTPTQPTQPTEPTRPAPSPVPAPIPTPAQVAARITPPRPSGQPAPAAVLDRDARPARTRPSTPATPARTLAPSSTDFSVTAQDAAQLPLPIVSPQLLAKATSVARQYRAEHGTPLTAGQLAVRLKVTSEQATHLLASMNDDQTTTTTPVPTVNGARLEAAR
jgi:hypothetical protein